MWECAAVRFSREADWRTSLIWTGLAPACATGALPFVAIVSEVWVEMLEVEIVLVFDFDEGPGYARDGG
jgi:hypothetical protein